VREKEEAGKRELLSDKTLFDQTLLPDSHRAIVYITWDITIEAVRKESLLADKWLTICAYMNSDDIPNALLETFASSSENNSNQETFEAALETLGSYSMLTIDQEKSSASIHHLVQEVIKLQSEDKGKGADNRSAVFGLLKRCFPYGPDRFTLVDHTQKRQLLPHLEAFLPQLDIWLKEVSTEKLRSEIEKNCLAWLLERMANVYSDLGNALKQRELLEQVLTIKERHYRPDSPEVASALANLGNAYGALGDAHKQRELLERALPIVEHHFGHEYPVASTLTNLGNAYGALGDAHKKRELLERALTINERHYGPDHPEVAITLANLGNAYGALGDAHKKRDLLERALTINERHCGLDHPVVASTLVN
jgi:tetratricopeptide (TPR) repeat protein